MTNFDRKALTRQAIERHFVDWACLDYQGSLLKLGAKFEAELEALIEFRDGHVAKFEALLSDFSDDELRAASGKYDIEVEGFGVRENELDNLRNIAMNKFPTYSRLSMFAIGKYPDELADYDYWAMRDSFRIEDFVWLSIGLEPNDDLRTYFEKFQQRPPKLDPVLKRAADLRFELIDTAERLGLVHRTKRVDLVHEWLTTVDLTVPDDLRTAVEKGWRRLRSTSVEPEKSVDVERVEGSDPREVRSLARLLTAIAIEEYGYQPSALRSPIPKEMESICDRQGLGVTRDTILKFLRLGANLQDK